MKLIEALQILKRAASSPAEALPVVLACGFTPLHLQTVLAARMQVSFPSRRVQVQTGSYGDLLGTIDAIGTTKPEFAAMVLEWADLDPRLGIRNPTGWRPADLPDILDATARRLALLAQALERASCATPIAAALPTLPLPPVAYVQSCRASLFQLRLEESLRSFAVGVSEGANIRFVSEQFLDQRSPPGERWDVKGDLDSGFPYKFGHASVLATALASLLVPTAPKKGLITDLDDTLWGGIVGELGEENISWDLDHGSQVHALYQILLRSLSETGVLIAAASKNDEILAQKALTRKDLLLLAGSIFPLEIHWRRKSSSVSRILRTWNIAGDSVVFVDDNPIELAEVKAEHPEVECIQFPREDPQAVLNFMQHLRDLFGKPVLTAEDTLRSGSVRAGTLFAKEQPADDGIASELLRTAEAVITLNFEKKPADPRSLELLNKTNQFNLNGRRYTEASWRSYLESREVVLMVVSYQDKYSVLGRIAVFAGRKQQSMLRVDSWVMSCRAFSRQIEERCLAEVFDRFGVDRIEFEFSLTPRNGYLQHFFEKFLGYVPESSFQLTKEAFLDKCPALFQSVRDLANG